MQPDEGETKELRNHVIIAGYGRVGQMIGAMLSEELIPFVAVDIDSNRWGPPRMWARAAACVAVLWRRGPHHTARSSTCHPPTSQASAVRVLA